MTQFTNMTRWNDAKLAKELAFAMLDSPDSLERDWAQAVHAEAARRKSAISRTPKPL